MKNKLYFIALCSIFALLTSCVRMYYQVYDTEYTNLKEGDNSVLLHSQQYGQEHFCGVIAKFHD